MLWLRRIAAVLFALMAAFYAVALLAWASTLDIPGPVRWFAGALASISLAVILWPKGER